MLAFVIKDMLIFKISEFQINISMNKDFINREQNLPLPKLWHTPVRNRVNFFQGFCYKKVCLDIDFHVNPSINSIIMTGRGKNQPLPLPCSAPGRNRVNLC